MQDCSDKINNENMKNINWPLPSNAKPEDYVWKNPKFTDNDLRTYDMEIIMRNKKYSA